MALALDPAASQFYADGHYLLGGRRLTGTDLVDRYAEMVERFPIWSLEDGMAEDDEPGWAAFDRPAG